MSVKAQDWAWRKRKIKGLEKLVLLALAKHHDAQKNIINATLKDIQQATGLAFGTIQKYTKSLADAEIISVKNANKPGDKCTYALMYFDSQESQKKNHVDPAVHAHKKPEEFGEFHKRMFDAMWDIYPRKRGKKNAERAWSKLPVTQKLFQLIMTDIRNRCLGEWSDQNPKFIPHFATYLNGHRWEDEPDASQGPNFEGENEYKKGL